MASPLTIIARCDNESDIQSIGEIVDQHQVERIIAGLPISMDGGFSKQTEKVRAFIESLRCGVNVPVEYRDERLSTVSARRLMQESSSKKMKYDDAVAASIILQAYLDEGTG